MACDLYVYRFDPSGFVKFDDFWRSAATVHPQSVDPVGPLLDKHRDAEIELRLVRDLPALWADVISRPGLDFSGIRLANATPPRRPRRGLW